jgi:sugar lactone lactonase YvrE
MVRYTSSVLRNYHCQLGEGPVWDADNQLLSWVDGFGCKVFIMDWNGQTVREYPTPSIIGNFVPSGDGRALAALENGVYLFTPRDGTFKLWHNPEEGVTGNRFNDGKADCAGRLVFGSMSLAANDGVSAAPASGALYVMEGKKCRRIVSDVTNSNGLAWNRDSSKMYYIDTPTQCVKEFDYNPQFGEVSNGHVCIRIPEEEGAPDGMTIDTDGMLWVAHWGGYKVSRWDPHSGIKIGEVDIPVKNVTCCTFGGPHLDILFITTAAYGVSGIKWEQEPFAGAIFTAQTGCFGYPANMVKLAE